MTWTKASKIAAVLASAVVVAGGLYSCVRTVTGVDDIKSDVGALKADMETVKIGIARLEAQRSDRSISASNHPAIFAIDKNGIFQ